MNIYSVLILSCLAGHASAGVFVPVVFNIFSGSAVDTFNNVIGDALANFDPYVFGNTFNKALGTIQNDDCGQIEAAVEFTLQELTGLSGMRISEIKMESFDREDSGTIAGFSTEMEVDELLINMDGILDVEACNEQEEQAFTGDARITNAVFKFKFDADVKLLGGFTVNSIDIETFELLYDDLGAEFSDMGPFAEVQEELTEVLESQAQSILSSTINATFLQDTIDAIL